MPFSSFGQKFIGQSGILQLMDDLGSALASGERMLMLGGGNPAHIPAVQDALRRRMYDLLLDEGEFEALVGNYSGPQGDRAFVVALAAMLRESYGWPLGPENITLTNGSQTAFFYLFNLLGGKFPDGSRKRILLPLAPEYIGYTEVGIEDPLFISHKPGIEHLDDRVFKYHPDFDALHVGPDIGAICISRPTNPTGNVLTDAEVQHLSDLARAHNIPLIIDNAYGMPFPDILFTEAQLTWDDHIVLCMSLSKLGLPGSRTGIIVANAEISRALAAMNAVLSLAPGSFGATMALEMVRTGEITRLSREVIRPFYEERAVKALAWFRQEMAGYPGHVHKPEGAFFLWLWFPELPITCQELYERLKARRVIVVPGRHFFPGLDADWRHKQECIRMNYAQEESVVREGIAIIAEEVKKAYGGG